MKSPSLCIIRLKYNINRVNQFWEKRLQKRCHTPHTYVQSDRIRPDDFVSWSKNELRLAIDNDVNKLEVVWLKCGRWRTISKLRLFCWYPFLGCEGVRNINICLSFFSLETCFFSKWIIILLVLVRYIYRTCISWEHFA